MQKALFASALVACALGVVGPLDVAGQSPLTAEQTLDRRAIGELEFSPDGTRLVFTVADPVKGTARPRATWLLEIETGRLRQLPFSGKNDAGPRWSPDGTSIAFTSERDGPPQLYVLPLSGGEAEQLTDRRE